MQVTAKHCCRKSDWRPTSTALMPTSMTTAPFLIQSPVIISALPQAAMTMSALEQISCPLGVRECTTVTVASRLCRSMAAGVPTMLLLPTTQADLPLMVTFDRSNSSMHPCNIAPKVNALSVSVLKISHFFQLSCIVNLMTNMCL